MTEVPAATGAWRTGSGEISDSVLSRIDTWWRAANYLSVGQIYLLDNPLLREPPDGATTSSRGCSATGARRPG